MRLSGRFPFRFPMPNNDGDAGGGAGGDKGAGAKAPATPAAARAASVDRAFEAAGLNDTGGQANETQRAAAVLKDGAGADDVLDAHNRRKAEEIRNSSSQPKAEEKPAADKGEKKPAKAEGAEKDKGGDKSGDKGERKAKDADAGDKGEKKDAKDDGDKGAQPKAKDGKFQSPDPDRQKQLDAERAAAAEKAAGDPRYAEAPKRMSEAARAAWKDAPEHVRADVHRVVGELEKGITEKSEGDRAWRELNEAPSPVKGQTYGQLAKALNTTIQGALDRYVEADMRLGKDPVGVLHKLLTNKGLDVRKVAQALLNADPDELKAHHEINDLRAENERLKAGEEQKLEQTKKAVLQNVRSEVETFKTSETDGKRDHPRFDELEPLMATLIASKQANTLKEAYEMADRARPGRKAPEIDSPDTAAQTRKSELSVTGSPTGGSDPQPGRRRSKNPREAVDRAFDDIGIR